MPPRSRTARATLVAHPEHRHRLDPPRKVNGKRLMTTRTPQAGPIQRTTALTGTKPVHQPRHYQSPSFHQSHHNQSPPHHGHLSYTNLKALKSLTTICQDQQTCSEPHPPQVSLGPRQHQDQQSPRTHLLPHIHKLH